MEFALPMIYRHVLYVKRRHPEWFAQGTTVVLSFSAQSTSAPGKAIKATFAQAASNQQHS